MKEKLTEAAKQAMQNAYAPYSHCKVGAALASDDGEIFFGCNMEGASFSPTICAERAAFAAAIAAGKRSFRAIAVCGGREGVIREPFVPCGVCRQVMREFCKDDFCIYVVGQNNEILCYTLGELLPHSFGGGHLK